MEHLIIVVLLQILLLSFLFMKDKNDGEKELFKEQSWKASVVVAFIFFINIDMYLYYYLQENYHIRRPIGLFVFQLFLSSLLLLYVLKTQKGIRILGFKNFDLKNNYGVVIISALILLLPKISGNFDGALITAKSIKDLGFLNGSIYVILMVITAPIIEESLFRGIIYSPYRKKYGATVAIILNALIFSVSHYLIIGSGNWTILSSGFVFCLLYEKTESIIPSIIAHSCKNLLIVITGFYMLSI